VGEIQHIWCCDCGAETPCERADQIPGAVFKCPACDVIYGCLRKRSNGWGWVVVDPDDAEFHGFLDEPEPEDDTPTEDRDA
jgi:NAD-dependent SIR2 family protein deacetylase